MDRIFHEINHPAIGDLPMDWKPPYDTMPFLPSRLGQSRKPQQPQWVFGHGNGIGKGEFYMDDATKHIS